ncbi:MAG TPA: hypothetical protein VJN18_19630 [Polyangiaceae bacterium]|nr:hypothetical protein [Polyangiaceae bacterium]
MAPWLFLLVACNVTPATTTGGADLPARGDCPRGLAVVSSDFQSSEVALLSPDGAVRSQAFLSSASSNASNLAAPLSGDLEAAASRSRDNELVLIDRFGTNVLSFVDAKTAAVRAQLPIGTGFDSNPQDYLEVSEHKAYVPRLSENRDAGREPFDVGSDLLLVDPVVPSIIGSLPMPHQAGFFPNPVALAQLGELVLVTLQHARPDFSGMADSEIVAVDTRDDSLRYRLTLSGLQNCGRVELSPDRRRLVVACASYVDPRGESTDVSKSGIVVLDAVREPPEELQRFSALELSGGAVQSSLELVTDDLLLFKTQTALGAEHDNQLLSLSLSSGRVVLLASAARDVSGAGFGIAFLGMSCQAGCGDPCLVADASRGRIVRLHVLDERLVEDEEIRINGAGLPPTGITPFW